MFLLFCVGLILLLQYYFKVAKNSISRILNNKYFSI